jgi:hypothetical protein
MACAGKFPLRREWEMICGQMIGAPPTTNRRLLVICSQRFPRTFPWDPCDLGEEIDMRQLPERR